MTTQDQEGLFTDILKSREPIISLFRSFFRLAFCDDVLKVVSQHERYTFTSDAKLLFKMAENVAKIDMKQLAIFLDHNVVRMSIGNA